MIILDTNVVSELMRSSPDPAVVAWVGGHPPTSLFITTVTVAEILYGIAIMPLGERRKRLEQAVSAMIREDFADRVLGFDSAAAHACAVIAARRRSAGHPIAQFDAQIAAIAASRNSAIATRNVSDFENCGLDVLDPWR
jgi:predicted nucleic acid-binding protein